MEKINKANTKKFSDFDIQAFLKTKLKVTDRVINNH